MLEDSGFTNPANTRHLTRSERGKKKCWKVHCRIRAETVFVCLLISPKPLATLLHKRHAQTQTALSHICISSHRATCFHLFFLPKYPLSTTTQQQQHVQNCSHGANGNWDASCMIGVASWAVFLDNETMLDTVADYYRGGVGNGRLTHYVYPSGQVGCRLQGA